MYGLRELLDSVQRSFDNKSKKVTTFISGKMNSVKAGALTYIVFYSKIINNVKRIYKQFYDNNIVAKTIIDYSTYGFDYIYSFFIRKKIEPFSSNWISTYILSKRDKNRYVGEEYTLLESYDFMINPYQYSSDSMICEINFNETCDAIDSIVLNSPSYVEGLVKMKLGGQYVYRIFDNNNELFKEFKMPLLSSKANFLSIEYTHPLMNNSIIINLNKSVYIANNQILSPTFIKMYLEYQSELYHFDMDYVLKVMDNNINSFELKFDKSVLLTEGGYLIV
jgi:hypothetical protein